LVWGDASILEIAETMAHVSNYLHCVWATKSRIPYFTETNTTDILIHIFNHARDQGIWIDNVNVYRNHLHCLLSLNPDQSLSTVIKLIKGESSCWINRNIMLDQKFGWCHEYYAASVSMKALPIVRHYIKNQKAHHQMKTWEQEEEECKVMITGLLARPS
jgi:putative transposase